MFSVTETVMDGDRALPSMPSGEVCRLEKPGNRTAGRVVLTSEGVAPLQETTRTRKDEEPMLSQDHKA